MKVGGKGTVVVGRVATGSLRKGAKLTPLRHIVFGLVNSGSLQGSLEVRLPNGDKIPSTTLRLCLMASLYCGFAMGIDGHADV